MELRPGQRLGGYEIVSHVKSGGMASLYLARRRGAAGFSRPVAIKVVHPGLAKDPKFIRMFLDEARLAVLIQHPNVVQVEELIEAEGTYLMVMEYVHGTSLFEVLRRLAKQGRRLSPELAASIAIQVADGLHAAHELRGPDGHLLEVVHRDISPQNILLSYSGHVKVIDFGIAKSRQRMDLTRTGVIRGKLGYMSPEQANATEVDRRTDVYATGIVLWEMLTSRRLFKGKTEVELLDKVRNPRVARPSLYGQVHPALENAVMAALAPPPEMRTKSAHEFRSELLRALPQAGAVHSSVLAGLLSTVMADSIHDGPLSWSEAGLTGEPVRPQASFLEDHTLHASAPDFSTAGEFDDDDDATFASHPGALPTHLPDLADEMATIAGHRPGGVPPPVPPPQGLPQPPPAHVPAFAAAPEGFQSSEPSASRQLVSRPAHAEPSNPQFTLPPGEDLGVATASYDPNDPRVPKHLQHIAKQPNKLANCLVTLISMVVLIVAIGVAFVLAYRSGIFEELLGPPGGTPAAPADAGAEPDAPVIDAASED